MITLRSSTSNRVPWGSRRSTPSEVKRRYGIAPAQYPEFIALRGDPSDGLPGAPGIGEKTATALLHSHDTLEGALKAVGTAAALKLDSGERPRVAAALRDNGEELRAFREIALLRTVELERPPDGATDLSKGAKTAAAFGIGLSSLDGSRPRTSLVDLRT